MPQGAIEAGRKGFDGVLAVLEGLIEQRVGREVAAIVARTDADVRDLGTLIQAVIGRDEGEGLRLALRTLDGGIERQRRMILAELVGDPRVSRPERLHAFERVVAERDQAPSQALLDRMAAATERMVAAHAALRRPAEGSTRAAIAEFVAAVERPNEAYRRLQRAGN